MNIDTLIYDVGAHRGEDTEYYLNKGFSVVAIEEFPEFCDELNKRFGDYITNGQLKVVNVAISSVIGKWNFIWTMKSRFGGQQIWIGWNETYQSVVKKK